MDEKHFYGMSEASLRAITAQIGEKIVSLEPAIEQMTMVVLPNKTKPFYSQQYLHCKMPINPWMGCDNIDMMVALCKLK